MEINQVFDEMYDGYTAKIKRWVPSYQDMLEGMVKALPNDFKPQKILDLGCGNGNTSQFLQQYFPHAAYLLVDASSEMLEGCRERFSGKGKFDFLQSFFQDLDLKKGHFDLIAAGLSIHHLRGEEKQHFFPQLHSWLRRDGFFVYADLMIDSENNEVHQVHLQEWKKESMAMNTTEEEWQYLMDHYERYDFPSPLQSTQNWLNQAGFAQVEVPFRRIGWTTINAKA